MNEHRRQRRQPNMQNASSEERDARNNERHNCAPQRDGEPAVSSKDRLAAVLLASIDSLSFSKYLGAERISLLAPYPSMNGGHHGARSGKYTRKQARKPFDPRLYQIASLGTLLLFGLLWLHFDVSLLQIVVTFGAALLTQYAGTRLAQAALVSIRSARSCPL